MRRRALHERLGRPLIEHARVDRAVVQFAEGEDRCQCHAAISSAKRPRLQQCEYECRDFVGERGIGFTAERRDLRPLHRVEKSELRIDDAGMRLRATEFRADRAVQFDDVLHRQIANAPVNR